MKFNIGDYVVYGGNEICRIDEVISKCFDGNNSMDYYRLVPADSRNASYYIPVEHIDERVRSLLSESEILAVIDNMPNVEGQWSNDRNERRNMFNIALRSDDYEKILSIMKSLYNEKEKRVFNGKHLISSDEKALNTAQNLIHNEFAFVLGINADDVPEFIQNRLESLQSAE